MTSSRRETAMPDENAAVAGQATVPAHFRPHDHASAAVFLLLVALAAAPGHDAASSGEGFRPSKTPDFDIELTYGVFRSQPGRLTVAADGIRYQESATDQRPRATLDVKCADIRTVDGLSRVADRRRRIVEVALRDRSYWFTAANTGVRNDVVEALSKACGV